MAAWLVWVIALAAFAVTRQNVDGSGSLLVDDPNLGGIAVIIELLAIAMLVFWLAALFRLARQHDWGWFVAVMVLQLIGLGVVGMAAYAIAGPVDVDLSRPGISS